MAVAEAEKDADSSMKVWDRKRSMSDCWALSTRNLTGLGAELPHTDRCEQAFYSLELATK
jgi:hypothetical protein